MKKNKTPNFWICVWLAIIAVLLLCGVILFAAYIYKFDPLSLFTQLFQTDAEVIWSAINVVATTSVGIFALYISAKLSKIEEQQHLLYTEPHILVDTLEVCSAQCKFTADGKRIKTVKDIDYPYYVNIVQDDHITDFSIISITFINTSEAFARLRFDKAVFKSGDNNTIASYNISTFGAHKTHVMLKQGGSGKIGLLISNDLLENLRGTKFTISTYLQNNFNDRYLDEQSYHISDVCEETVTFMPYDIKKNVFKKID